MSSESLHLSGDFAVIATTLVACKVFTMLLVPPKQDDQDASTIAMTSTLNGVKSKWKGKGKEKEITRKPVPKPIVAEDEAEETGDQVDWTQYEPPAGLKTAHDIETDFILNLLKHSIANVKARIADEAVRKIEIEAFKDDEEEAQGKVSEAEQTEDPALEVAQQEPGTDQSEADATTAASETNHVQAGSASVDFAGTKLTIDQHGLLQPVPIPPKPSIRRRLLGLLRRLNKREKAESSSAATASTREMGSASSLDLDARLNALMTGRRDNQGVWTESTLGNSTDSGSSIHREQA